MPTFSPQDKRQSIFAPVLEWCYDRIRANLQSLNPAHDNATCAAPKPPDPVMSGIETPQLPRRCYDAKLLFHRMEMLLIDREELAKDDPLLFRELQGRCTLCRDQEQCACDLAAGFDGAALGSWQEYCPNAATLNSLGAALNCSFAAQHLKRPRSD